MSHAKVHVVHELVRRGLLDRTELVDGGVTVVDSTSRHRNSQVIRKAGGGYFVKEAIQSPQMNFRERRAYIDELQQSGFDTVPLQVQLYKKFSVPLFAFILALVAAPFAFQAGTRGAMAGVGLSFAIYIAYWSVDQVFEQLGNLSELPPQLAAWSPDVVFSLVGLYFVFRMRT